MHSTGLTTCAPPYTWLVLQLVTHFTPGGDPFIRKDAAAASSPPHALPCPSSA